MGGRTALTLEAVLIAWIRVGPALGLQGDDPAVSILQPRNGAVLDDTRFNVTVNVENFALPQPGWPQRPRKAEQRVDGDAGHG